MKCLNSNSRSYFVCSMRLFFGLWLLYAGASKWLGMGHGAFISYITSSFDATWSPHALNVALAWLIIIAEPVLALLILSGKKPRVVWTLTSFLMFLLLIGQTILMKPAVADLWFYLVLTSACAALSDAEPCAHETSGN